MVFPKAHPGHPTTEHIERGPFLPSPICLEKEDSTIVLVVIFGNPVLESLFSHFCWLLYSFNKKKNNENTSVEEKAIRALGLGDIWGQSVDRHRETEMTDVLTLHVETRHLVT